MEQVLVTSENKTPIVEILNWFLLTVGILSVAARTATKLLVTRTINADDYLIFLSLVSLVSVKGRRANAYLR